MYNILGYDRNAEIFAAVHRSRLTHQYRDPGQSCNRILFQGEILGGLNLTGRARFFHGALGFQAKPG
jgi:hypothetical protein